MKYRITQTNEYLYSGTVEHSINQIRLTPISDATQTLEQFVLDVSVPYKAYEYVDYWGNRLIMLYVHQPHRKLTLCTVADVDVVREPRLNHGHSMPFNLEMFTEYLSMTPYTILSANERLAQEDALWQRLSVGSTDGLDRVHAPTDPLAYAAALSDILYRQFSYQQGVTDVDTTAAAFLQGGKGVCQDFTHLMLALCRRRSIPARYVSGYLYVGEDSALRGDAAMHAWVEVYARNQGWVGFDPTNNVPAGSDHIRVAVGRDYTDVAPLRGVVSGGGAQRSTTSVSVQRLSPACAAGVAKE